MVEDGDDSTGSSGGLDPDGHRSPGRVREVYDEIAPHFSNTRAHPWPEVESFLAAVASAGGQRSVGRRQVGLDIGCGNGRHTRILGDIVETAVGVDLSRDLLVEARATMAPNAGNGGNGENDGCRGVDRGGWTAELAQADAAALPVAAGTVDVALYVATIHHLPDRETRVGSLAELSRALRPGARALVSAWSTAHDRFDAATDAEEGFDTTLDWTLPDGETVPRFYHIYAPEEFGRDLRDAGLVVDSAVVSSGNCYAEVRSRE